MSLTSAPARAQSVFVLSGDRRLEIRLTPGGVMPGYRGDDAVDLRIEADDVGVMRLVEKTSDGWDTLCALPCRTTANPRSLYRIEGDTYTSGDDDDDDGPSVDKVAQTSPFHLGPARSQFLLVHPHSAYAPLIGWVLAPIGAGFTGLGVAGVGGALDKTTSFRVAFGLPFLVGGAAFLGVGGYLILRHGTSVVDESGHRLARDTVKLPGGLALGPRGIVF
ncbi:MAG TPA: hypothetical protein VHB21_17690 [Minicystis sp.]|nr:hypothetical protein [Minicystis sp.]